jgi:hypothetical protein
MLLLCVGMLSLTSFNGAQSTVPHMQLCAHTHTLCTARWVATMGVDASDMPWPDNNPVNRFVTPPSPCVALRAPCPAKHTPALSLSLRVGWHHRASPQHACCHAQSAVQQRAASVDGSFALPLDRSEERLPLKRFPHFKCTQSPAHTFLTFAGTLPGTRNMPHPITSHHVSDHYQCRRVQLGQSVRPRRDHLDTHGIDRHTHVRAQLPSVLVPVND